MEQNVDSSDARTKRKQPPSPANERPMKQIRAQPDLHGRNGSYVPTSPELQAAEEAPSSPQMDCSQDSLDDMQPAHLAGAVHDTAEWQKTIEHVVRNVVSIHFCQTCSFDTDSAVSSEATGFVVDAEKGYILTNRHVVGAGPFIGYCIFDNHEEVG
jgi:S1-C subfamily serine protease